MKNESRIVHEDLARQISHLMSRPDRVLTFPGETESKELDGIQTGGSRSAIRNVQGSSAGAGSGEFHVYRALRRKEQVRIRTIDDRNKEDVERREFEEKRQMMVKKIEEKTERRRRERLKKKIRKNSKKKENCKTEEPQDRGGAEKSGSGNLIVESGADLTF